MKHSKIILFTGLLAAGLAKPNQAAPIQVVGPSNVTLTGDFQKPGSYSFLGQWRLTDAIATAGGIKGRPEAVRLSVQRGSKTLSVDAVGLILQSPKDVTQNLLLQSGDVVIVHLQEVAGVKKPLFEPKLKDLPDSQRFEFNGKDVHIVPLVKNRPLTKNIVPQKK